MRSWAVVSLYCSSLLLAGGCKAQHDPLPPSPPPSAAAWSAPSVPPSPARGEIVALEKALQASKLRVPALHARQPRLAFGQDVIAQLSHDALRVLELSGSEPLVEQPLEGPRALLTLADGSLLAVAAHRLAHWRAGEKRARLLPGPALLPGAELYADAQRADVLWVFDAGRGGVPATLSSYRLAAENKVVLLPEQTVALEPAGGVVGVTLEGVWLYLLPGRARRFAPNGARLPELASSGIVPPVWALPAARVDQSLWIGDGGEIKRVRVSPTFASLSRATGQGNVIAADVGNGGRLLAVVAMTGAGPRFELRLMDAVSLGQLARVDLRAEAPTGKDDWVDVVTRNQRVVVDPRQPRVAVGGPDRATIFDAQGHVILSIPSE